MSDFAEKAAELLTLANPQSETACIAAAHAYATLALAEATAELKRPEDEVPQIPFDQTREGWSWDGRQV